MAEFEALSNGRLVIRADLGAIGHGSDVAMGGWGMVSLDATVTVPFGGAGAAGVAGFGGAFPAGGSGTCAVGGYGIGTLPTVTVGVGYGEVGALGFGSGYTRTYGQGAGEAGVAGFGGAFLAGGHGNVAAIGYGSDVPIPEQNPIMLLQTPGFLYMVFGYQRSVLTDTVALAGSPLPNMIHVLTERLALTAPPESMLSAIAYLRDDVDFIDRLAVVWRMLLAESMALTDTAEPSMLATESVLEMLTLVAGPGSSLEARTLVAEALALRDALAVVAKEQIDDTAVFGEAFSSALAARTLVLDALLFDAVPAASARVLAIVEESLVLGDTPASMLEAFSRLQETIGFQLTIRLGDDVYTAWVVNTETRAAWEYEGWRFNSMCKFDGKHYGAAEDGVYTLDGDTDDGDAINARFRLGMSNLGTGKLKRFPALYLGVDTNGTLLIKAVVTEVDGTRSEHWYSLTQRGTAGMRESRVKLGRGLKSVFYDFEVANVDGADFDFSAFDLQPLVLDRRVRGRDV